MIVGVGVICLDVNVYALFGMFIVVDDAASAFIVKFTVLLPPKSPAPVNSILALVLAFILSDQLMV